MPITVKKTEKQGDLIVATVNVRYDSFMVLEGNPVRFDLDIPMVIKDHSESKAGADYIISEAKTVIGKLARRILEELAEDE